MMSESAGSQKKGSGERHLLYERAFGSDAGKEVLKDLKERFRYGKTVFHADPQVNAFNQGAQSVVNRIMSILNQEERDDEQRHEQRVEPKPYRQARRESGDF